MDSRTALLLRAGVAIAVLLLIIGLVDMFSPMVRDRVLFTQQAFAYARQSSLGWVVLAPFDLLTLVFATEHIWPDLFIWAGASLIMISLVVLAAMQLDQYFTETSLIASHKRQARMSRVRAGGVFAHHSSGPAKASLPSFPRLGGAGTIAWRQFTNAMRNSRGMVFFLGIMTLATAPIIYGIEEFGGDQGGDQLAVMISSMVVPWVLLILPGMLRFDFRAEINHMDVLKSLPISPLAMTAGQVFVPTLVLIAVIGVLMVILAILLESMRTGLLIALPFVAPVAALLIAIENALFLLSPTRAQSTPGDVQFVGRQMTRIFAKLGLLAAALGMAALVGGTVYATAALVWDATTLPYVLAGTAAWGTLALATYLVIRLGAMLYARFDPGLHTPA
jgi:hypothetical protein